MTKPLLTIQLNSIDDVPTVYYKGDKLEGKQRIAFDWVTDDDMERRPYIGLHTMGETVIHAPEVRDKAHD